MSASYGNLRGIFFFANNRVCRYVGLLLIACGIVWFYATKNRNINDTEGGIDANDQALWFFLGVVSALICTFFVTSISQKKLSSKPKQNYALGIENLKDSTYLFAIKNSLTYWANNWRK